MVTALEPVLQKLKITETTANTICANCEKQSVRTIGKVPAEL